MYLAKSPVVNAVNSAWNFSRGRDLLAVPDILVDGLRRHGGGGCTREIAGHVLGSSIGVHLEVAPLLQALHQLRGDRVSQG